MKRLIVTGLLVGLTVSGLCLAGAWSGQGMAMMASGDDPNGGDTVGPELRVGTAIQPVWLADDPNDPNVPIDPNSGPE